jgi:hypothetical protein
MSNAKLSKEGKDHALLIAARACVDSNSQVTQNKTFKMWEAKCGMKIWAAVVQMK